MMSFNEKNIQRMVQYFEEGCKDKEHLRIGVEVEHFVLSGDGTPITYEQLIKVMKQAMKEGDLVFEEQGSFLGYYNEEFSISLEPAAQLEISVMPQCCMFRVEEILNEFYADYGRHLEKIGFHLVAKGYHPTRKAEKLPLIPKERYNYMNQYFQTSGSRGYQMMRASASTQVAVDYENEADFVHKYRLAAALVPLFSLLTDNAPVYEEKKQEKHMARTYVWQDVDQIRCGIPKGCFEDDFGFESYIREMYQKPFILMKKKGVTTYTGDIKGNEYFADKEMDVEDIEHFISMFFPDIRVKHYLEIRPADSMPFPYVIAYMQLIKNIFYSPSKVERLNQYLQVKTVQMVEEGKESLMENGYDGMIYGKKAGEVLEKVMETACEGTTDHEKERIEPMYQLVRERKTLAMEENR